MQLHYQSKVWTQEKQAAASSNSSSDVMFLESAFSDLSGERDDLIQVQSGCGVCEKVLRDPVSITCGHNFCRQCISFSWDHSRPFDCPQCIQTSRRHRVMRRSGSAECYTQVALQEETEDLHKPVDDVLQRVKDQHKTNMKNMYERLFEGNKLQRN